MTASAMLPPPLVASSAAAHALADADTAFVVDKDDAQCHEAGYQSIQAAIDAALSGALISVCPDLYTERVTVSRVSSGRHDQPGDLPETAEEEQGDHRQSTGPVCGHDVTARSATR